MINKTKESKLIVFIILIGLIIRLSISWQETEKLIEKILIDDAFISFSIARNIINKNIISFNGISITNGFQPLWVFLITPLFKITQSDTVIHYILTLSSLIDSLTILIIYKLGKIIYNWKVGILGSFIYSINPLYIFFTHNGIEVALSVFLINLCLLYLFSIKKIDATRYIFLGILLGLSILSRMDSVFLLFGVLVYININFKKNIRQGIINSIIVMTATLIIISPWLIWNYENFKTFIPSSGKAVYKLGHMICDLNKCSTTDIAKILVKNFLTGGFLLIYYFGPTNISMTSIILVLSILYFLFISIKNNKRIIIPQLIYLCLILSFYSFYLWRIDLRYFTASSSLLLLVLCNGIFIFSNKFKKINRFLLSIIFAVFVFFILINSYKEWTRGYIPWQSMMYEGGLWAKDNVELNETISSFNSGIIQYYSERRNINLDGVINFEAIKAIENRNITDYIKSKNVTYLLDTILDIKSESSDNIDLWEVNPWTNYMGKNYKTDMKIIKKEIREFETVSGDKMKVSFFIARVIN